MSLNDIATVGGRLAALREVKGVSQAGLGDMTGLSQARIQKIENGHSLQPRCIGVLSKYFEVNPAWLQFGSEYAPMQTPTSRFAP